MRNNSLDTFRLFASFAVITLHVTFGNLPLVAVEQIRLLGRFAVPFFFLLSGHFFYENYQKKGNQYFLSMLQRLMGIFIIACLVYALINFRKLSYSFSLLYEGTSFHLWFLSSLIIGVFVCWYQYSYIKSKKIMLALSVVILLLYSVSDTYSVMFPFRLNNEFCRYLLSIPFVYFGACIAQHNIKLSNFTSGILIISGIVIQILEVRFLNLHYGYNEFNSQFLLGTLPFSLGMFFISFNGLKSDLLSELGRKYSLSIYIYHLFVNFFIFKIIRYVFGESAGYVFMFSALISFGITLAVLMFINKYFINLFRLLEGEINVIRRFASKKVIIYPD